jgi:hypothetical protein
MYRYIQNAAIFLLVCLLIVGVIWFFSASVNNLSQDQLLEDKQQLEQALLKACVACYAAEGCYPPSLEHLQTYYGVQINTEVFTVKYEVFASNLMPEITVLVN